MLMQWLNVSLYVQFPVNCSIITYVSNNLNGMRTQLLLCICYYYNYKFIYKSKLRAEIVH